MFNQYGAEGSGAASTRLQLLPIAMIRWALRAESIGGQLLSYHCQTPPNTIVCAEARSGGNPADG